MTNIVLNMHQICHMNFCIKILLNFLVKVLCKKTRVSNLIYFQNEIGHVFLSFSPKGDA